ncbi:MAG: proprotein convertase P-domain-containing protein [Planctomycetaceae bacterium]
MPRSPIRTGGAILGMTVIFMVAMDSTLPAQSGLRKSLERLDRNKNGEIDPDEITPLARPYLERITGGRRGRSELQSSISIERLQEAARVYYATQNGASRYDVRSQGQRTVRPFTPADDQQLVPEFGLGQMKYPYVKADLDEAHKIMRRYDYNKDGYIDRLEAARSRWTHRNPFDDDLDHDDRISRMELTQRYARRRLLAGLSDELRRKNERLESTKRASSSRSGRDRRSGSSWSRRGGTKTWLTASLIGRFDVNRNGRLERSETRALGIPLAQIDSDLDGEVTREELYELVSRLQDEAGDRMEGLPGWFYELDANRDGQVAMREFSVTWSVAKRQEFALLDANGDGLLIPSEVLKAAAIVGGSYRSQDAQVLPPRKTIISEIEVEDDYLIDDVNVEISITHSHTSHLDAYLTGPGGQRIELFTEIGGTGDHFEQTIFDDQSPIPVSKGKSPFSGAFRPEGLDKRQPGLKVYNGTSVKGSWQLVIRGSRNDRFGMLHRWGLTVKPQDASPEQQLAAPVPVEDTPDSTVKP